ncbi:MAG TPA: mechanosensitive ion channel family protein [Candidatus Nanoarchaeia archaeon]|nr:mechanosensitive ion channel family protein [Candidatus Nanoarchaeia archaeon]
MKKKAELLRRGDHLLYLGLLPMASDFIIHLVEKYSFAAPLQNDYIFSALILLFSLFLAQLTQVLFRRYLERWAEKTKSKLDDMFFDHVKRPLFYFILAYGLKLALVNLELNGIVSKITTSITALLFLFIILRAIDIAVEVWGLAFAKRTKTRVDDVLLPLLHKVLKVLFFIIGALWVLHIWEIDITPYLAGVGISGLVLGLALQDSLKNVFGGIMLLLDQTFRVGDKIRLEDGMAGTVYDIGLRSTKLVTADNEIIFVPNGYLANSRIQNYSRPSPRIRTSVAFGVAYGSDPAKVKKTVLDVLYGMSGILKDPAPEVQFLEMGDFALKYKAYFWVERWERAVPVQVEATEAIYHALNKAKIPIPFPTYTVQVEKEKK